MPASPIWALVDGLEGTAAKVARLAILPFVASYSALDAIVGFATGTIGMVALFAAGLVLERRPVAAAPERERIASGPAPAA